MAKLTATQEVFVKNLFGPANGNLKTAAQAAIGSEDYSQLMTDDLLQYIKSRADNELVLNVPKAIYIMQKMLDETDGSYFVNDKLHKVAADILDRAGISRQERPQHQTTAIGVIFLPNKAALPTPPQQEVITLENKLPIDLVQDGIQTTSQA